MSFIQSLSPSNFKPSCINLHVSLTKINIRPENESPLLNSNNKLISVSLLDVIFFSKTDKCVKKCKLSSVEVGARGGIVVKVLRYKPAGRGFDSRCVIGIFQ
jgi:hypothetical protein